MITCSWPPWTQHAVLFLFNFYPPIIARTLPIEPLYSVALYTRSAGTPAWNAKKNPLAQPPRHVADCSALQAPASGCYADANDANATIGTLQFIAVLLR